MGNVFAEFVKEHLYLQVILLALTVAAMLSAMLVDLIFGVKKAKKCGQATSSTGYKKTCEKAQKYFSPFMVLVFIDLITCAIIPVPIFSMAWAAWCVFCEFKSVREKAWKKAELREAERTMNIIIKNKGDIEEIVKNVVFSIDQKRKENNNEKNT